MKPGPHEAPPASPAIFPLSGVRAVVAGVKRDVQPEAANAIPKLLGPRAVRAASGHAAVPPIMRRTPAAS